VSGKMSALLAILIFVADQWTKSLVVAGFPLGDSRPVIPGFFSLTHVRNRGGAFGLLADLPPVYGQLLFVLFAAVTVTLLAWMLRRTPRQDLGQRLALTFVIGGAIGNLYDRIRFGEVVDFLDVFVGTWHWPAFNVADSFITMGVILLFWAALRAEPERAPAA